jgi:hypothetical protein
MARLWRAFSFSTTLLLPVQKEIVVSHAGEVTEQERPHCTGMELLDAALNQHGSVIEFAANRSMRK